MAVDMAQEHENAAHAHSGHAGMNVECDGSINLDRKGSWKGHVGPGVVFIVWGCWWAYAAAAAHLWRHGSQRGYRARSWYPVALRGLWFLEPALKLLLPVLGVSIELLLDHQLDYRYLYCPSGTQYEGRFAVTHMNNWQHTASYPAFLLSGLVDLAARHVPLPAGTTQGVLGCAFGIMAFLMGTHEKHEPQDRAVHWLLFLAMLLCTITVFLDMALRRSALVGLAKALALILQGAWLVQIAVVQFEGRPQWSPEYGGGAMFAPVAFAAILLAVLASLFAFYTLLALLRQHTRLARAPFLPEEEDDEEGEEKQGSGQGPGKCGGPLHHRYDSANQSDQSDDNESPLGDAPGAQRGITGAGAAIGGMAPFRITHTRPATVDRADAFV